MVKKILVIEDEVQTREIFLNCLSFENFKGIGAEDGSTGIKLALQHHPDLVVCDIMMPDMDGYEVLANLRQQENTAAIPFIFLTAKVTMEDLRWGMTLGADDYLTKPCTVEQFLEAISARLKRQEDIQKGVLRQQSTPSHPSPDNPTEDSNIFPNCPKLAPVFQFIEENFRQSINLSDVAKSVGYSSAYLTSLTQSHTGRTVKSWIIERRMVEARHLLANTTQSIKQVADTVGYTDAGYFTRQFRKLYGVTPQVWRNDPTV